MLEPRRDRYGAPLPELTDAHREAFKERAANVTQRRQLHAALEDLYSALLRRGIHADVTVSFRIVNGIITGDLAVGVTRYHRAPEE